MACFGCAGAKYLAPEVSTRPKIHQNGDVELTQEPTEPIEGFKPDPENPKLLKNKWPSCPYRMTQFMLNSNGNYNMFPMCLCAGHPKQNKIVHLSDCEPCKSR